MAQKALVEPEIIYAIPNAALLDDTLPRIARKTLLKERDVRQQLKLLKASRKADSIERPTRTYHFITTKGERYISDLELFRNGITQAMTELEITGRSYLCLHPPSIWM